MTSTRFLAAAAAAVALLMIAGYLALIHSQGDEPAIWFIAGLAVGALLAAYAAMSHSSRRRPALLVSGVVLSALGLLGILSVGLPVIVAGVLAFIAAGLHRPEGARPWRTDTGQRRLQQIEGGHCPKS